MRVHAVWSDGPEAFEPRWILTLRGVEWVFLMFGLVALDIFIWMNASAIVYESYGDWAFDQQLRGLAPSALRFAEEEIGSLGRKRVVAAPLAVPRSERSSSPKLVEKAPLVPSAFIARLEIPNLHLVAIVQEGADGATLQHAVGHIPGTALPGGLGNVGLAGHRDTLFRPLRLIQINDAIDLETQTGTYRYRVESMRIVAPRDIQVLKPSGTPSLTLVTCYPFYYVGSSPKRFVVRAGLVSTTPAQ